MCLKLRNGNNLVTIHVPCIFYKAWSKNPTHPIFKLKMHKNCSLFSCVSTGFQHYQPNLTRQNEPISIEPAKGPHGPFSLIIQARASYHPHSPKTSDPPYEFHRITTKNLVLPLQKLKQDDDDEYLNAAWSDGGSLKRRYQGLRDISWRPSR